MDEFFDHCQSSINKERLDGIRQVYADADPYPGFSKYLDVNTWLKNAIAHARLARLQDSKPLAILDIGTGAGYFPFVCNELGHRAVSIDVPCHDFYTKMASMLNVERIEYSIQKFERLPDFGQRFDVVTAFAICFNGHATEELWGPEEWKFLLRDISENVLNNSGRLILKLNPEPDGSFYTSDLLCLFKTLGASVDGNIVELDLSETSQG